MVEETQNSEKMQTKIKRERVEIEGGIKKGSWKFTRKKMTF